MTTASTSLVLAQTSNATFQAWVQEIYTNLVTNCGLTQLAAAMDSGQMAVPCATATPVAVNTSAGYYMFAFNDALGQGPLITGTALAALTQGTGYNGGAAGTFTGVNLSGGTGSGAKATVVLGASGVISSITPTTAGTGYNIGDELIVTSANMVTAGAAAGGGSSGFAFVNQLNASASPVIIKLEFGSSASNIADPMMWITIGTSWTSNGTLGASQVGAVTTRVAALCGLAPLTTTTAYTSRYCYNAAYGFLGLVFKIGGQTAPTPAASFGGFVIFRSSGTAGTPISNGVSLITNSFNATGQSGTNGAGYIQTISYTNNTVYPTLAAASSGYTWSGVGAAYNGGNDTPFNLTSTAEGGNVFVFPVLMFDPVFRFSAVIGVVLTGDVPLGNTYSAAIIGGTALTFLQVGLPFGGTALNPNGSTVYVALVMLWQ